MEQQPPCSILICDDSIEEIRVLVAMLRSANYRIIVSNNGRDAYNRASVLQPDLILLDVRMPMMDGFATCRLLKAHADTRDIPVIFLTAANELCERLEGLRLGAVDYVVKPAYEEEVLLRVGIHLKARRTAAVAQADVATNSNSAMVEAAIQILDAHLSNPPSIDELARQVGSHRHHLSEAFKEVFGSTVFAWLRERRMNLARDWLTQTSLSIQAIGDDLGFSTPGNFSTAFRERFGVAPGEYRKVMSRLSTGEQRSDEQACLEPDRAPYFRKA